METTELPKPTEKDLTKAETFIQSLTQPLSPFEYLANALINAVIIFAVFSAGNYILERIKEVRQKM